MASIGSVTSELWPSMKSSIRTSWKILRHPDPTEKSRLQLRSTESTANPSQAKIIVSPTVDLPDCLRQTPMAPLRASAGMHAMLNQRTLKPFSYVNSKELLSPSSLVRRATGPISPVRHCSILAPFRLKSMYPSPTRQIIRFTQQRTLFGVNSSQNLLAHMEQTANNNPTSATAQNAFYSALLRASMPAIMVERYQTGRYASNPACEQTYMRALERIGQTEGVSGLAGSHQSQGQSTLNSEQLQAIGQAVAAQTRGGNISISHGKGAHAGMGAKESPVYVIVEESIGSTIFKWVKFFFWFGLLTYLAMVFITLVVETTGILKKVGAVQNNEAQPQHQTVRFSDVHGCDEAKEELQELVEFLKDPEKFSTLGGKLPKGVLLVGPPGTGKTLLARAVAGEAGVPFFFMSGSEFDEVYVGVGAKRIRELFNSARSKAPAIIFIDELDAVGGKRNERDAAYVKQTLNQLLTELDGFSQQTGVIILAATNFPQLLDKALTRPGRFDRHVVVPLPDVRGRMEILKHHMKNVQTGADVDETAIARGTPGFSGADLENLVNQAAVRASRNKQKKVGMLDFDWAKDKIMMGAERRSAIIQQKDKVMTAYHEGGHALVAMFTEGAYPVYKATIMPRGISLGMTHFLPEMDQVSKSKKQYIAEVAVAMGGKVAEELIYGSENVSSGASGDIETATRLAYEMVTRLGFSDLLGDVDLDSNYNQLSSETKQKIEHEVQRLVDEGRQRATKVLNERRKELEVLAKALIEYEVLSLEEIQKVLKGEKLQKVGILANTPIKVPEIGLPPGLGGAVPGAGPPPGTGNGDESGPGGEGGARL
ncbi:ATP-dependent zinc metalloprotease FTSH 4, mitochondrial [Trapelia coarctata]|nr:ATP-dependent zinc metalloprotease FTSH 4, mitochondrial [Trapelia coarctata]